MYVKLIEIEALDILNHLVLIIFLYWVFSPFQTQKIIMCTFFLPIIQNSSNVFSGVHQLL